jgi:hypothetical protein
MKNVNQVIKKLNECGITVYAYKEKNKLCGYELNTYTDAGVNQILFIDFRDSEMNPKNASHFIELFNERVNDIDINEEMKVHSEDKRYMQEIGYEVGIQDFKDWKANLQNIFTETNKKSAQQRHATNVGGNLDDSLTADAMLVQVQTTLNNPIKTN